jgi:hypothetical protein
MTPGIAACHTLHDGRKFHGPKKKLRDFRGGTWGTERSGGFMSTSNIFNVLGALFCNFARIEFYKAG